MDETLLANNTQHCWAQHVGFICMEPNSVGNYMYKLHMPYSLKPVKLFNRPIQTDATLLANNTQQYCDVWHPFAQAFRKDLCCRNLVLKVISYLKPNSSVGKQIPESSENSLPLALSCRIIGQKIIRWPQAMSFDKYKLTFCLLSKGLMKPKKRYQFHLEY